MAEQWTLGVFAYIADTATRERFQQRFPEVARLGPLLERIPWEAVSFHPHDNEEEVEAALQSFFESPGGRAALLLSDGLADDSARRKDARPDADARALLRLGRSDDDGAPQEDGTRQEDWRPQPTGWAKQLLENGDLKGRLWGTIAILERYQRVRFIDRVLRRYFDSKELLETLRWSAERLMYLRPVPRRPLPRPVVVRRINDETELSEYFRLRHSVYRIMGYLDPRVEFAESQMELNASDSGALHIGAFEQGWGGRQTLVGTARVVGVEDLDKRSVGWAESLARHDTVLRTELQKVLPLKLPIFHSMKVKEPYSQLLTVERCAELSRVIVRDPYRGTGLSTVLTKFAILAAAERGVDHLFLECLPVHVGMYAKLGFETIEGVEGEVIDVNKPMVAMQMTPERLERLRLDEASGPPLRVIRAKGYLCACKHDVCYRAQYGYFLSPDCPLYS